MACKKSDQAVFLGSGPSINTITDEQWNKIILEYDAWTVNNWVYHPWFVPDFYHIEVKWYDYELMQKRLLEKKDQYADVNFIFPMNKTIGMQDGRRLPLHEVAFEGARKYHYAMRGRDHKRTHDPFNADYKMHPRVLTKSYDMSLTALFELLYKMGYKRIVLFGVDLDNSRYFWTGGDPIYGQVHHQTNKAHEGKDPNLPHNTHRIAEFIVDFQYRWMRPANRSIVVGHKKTALYGKLRMEEL